MPAGTANPRVSNAELKQALALQHPHDKTAYTAGKAPFITAVLTRLGL